jgi:o-succinylbenzoate synthase
MRIDRVDLLLVRMGLITPFNASTHGSQELNHVLIRAEGEGLVGWGEASTLNDPYYLGETYETAWHILERFLVPPVIGKDWSTIEELVALFGPVKGNTFARAGLEMAGWDLLGKATGRSVASMLGGTRSEILAGVSLGIEKEVSTLCDRIARHLDEDGYRRIKIKIAPGKDVRVVEAVRKLFPDVPLMVDANSAYTLKDTAHLQELDAFNLTMIEQPLAWNDIVDHRKLQQAIHTPICLDESIRTFDDARHAIDLESCKIINLKVARVGGLLEAKRIHDEAYTRGIPLWVGGMHDYGIGRGANVSLASLPGITLPGDISASKKYFVEDIVDPEWIANRGAIQVRTEPGLGVNVVEERVRARSVRSATFGRA